MVTLRTERPGDESAIHRVTEAAFRDMPFSDLTEPAIIDGLRAADAMTLSLVAVDDAGSIVGQIAFSPVAIGRRDDGYFGLGPLSVEPALKRQGIGSLLVREGVERLRALGANAIVLVGDPGYYARFGFTSEGALSYGDVPAEYVQHLTLAGDPPRGEIAFHPAFGSA